MIIAAERKMILQNFPVDFEASEILGGVSFTFHPTNFFAAMVAL